MPIFEYICRDCHQQFETLVTASRPPACPACRGAALDKQHSVFAVSAKSASVEAPAAAPCGDPRGAGSCRLN